MKMFLVRAKLTDKQGNIFTKNMMMLAAGELYARFRFKDLHEGQYSIEIKSCTDVGNTYLISYEKEK